ncbi:MAG: glycosyltransferase family 2 protein, partial [Gammaproteobacteria bacterium]
MTQISIIIPARNEARSLESLLPAIRRNFPKAELIVVNDGSTDDTPQICAANDVHAVSHPYPKGNGAAIKSGARAASGDILVFMDGDGQHRPEEIQSLLARIEGGYDMVVGARSQAGHASRGRLAANSIYNWLATRITGHHVADLTSGFRAVRATMFREFLYLLPNGFSYPTTITMAFFRAGYSVTYAPITAEQRVG